MTAPTSQPGQRPVRRPQELVLAATVGLVLADSSIVTLALPEILRQFDTTVLGVSWVLTAFNLVLAAAMLPAARFALRGNPAAAWGLGLATFAAASLACALAPSIAVLIVARCVQALGGAAVIAGAIEAIAGGRGSHQLAAPVWGAAGMIGLAIGPAVGGALTEVLSWEAIFALQVPVVLVLPVALRIARRHAIETGPEGRLDLAPEVALGLLSAGLTGALFLLVVMLTEGWRHTPLEAAVIVSLMPLATLATSAVARRRGALTAAGAVLMAGGLAALGLVPEADWTWTLAPQALVGVGLAMALPGLTERALAARDPRGRRAAGTIAARHTGIVIGLVLLTPVFSAELDDQERAAERSGTALLLDADLAPATKVELGAAIAERLERAGGRLPRLDPAFRRVDAQPGSQRELERLEASMNEEIQKAATAAFSLSFLLAGALALAALVPIFWRRPA